MVKKFFQIPEPKNRTKRGKSAAMALQCGYGKRYKNIDKNSVLCENHFHLEACNFITKRF